MVEQENVERRIEIHVSYRFTDRLDYIPWRYQFW
jgi:hypothetical protein